MNPTFKNIIAVLAGFIVGSIVNMGLVTLGPMLIAPPAGVDPSDMESLKAGMHLFEAKHFIFPFLAHALGTFVGALVAYKLAATYKKHLAYFIGAFFFLGGIMVSRMLPAPTWFTAVDLVFAYIPMAWLAVKLGGRSDSN